MRRIYIPGMGECHSPLHIPIIPSKSANSDRPSPKTNQPQKNMTNTTIIAPTYTQRQATREDKNSERLPNIPCRGEWHSPLHIPIIPSKSANSDRL
ncbi:MAG: hypothetical protein SWX82_18095 [Cyanobacteriota bacterium]|nr:hypothetical protein [Cyanobacteriota bacterium]